MKTKNLERLDPRRFSPLFKVEGSDVFRSGPPMMMRVTFILSAALGL